ncbi:MAG: hypothetical protein AAB794_01025 [Patescibacteria group bacterium]
MDQSNHHDQPELWFRPSPAMSFSALLSLFEVEEITATPRLGKRDAMHPKGYVLGTVVTARLFDENRQERIHKKVYIDRVTSKLLRDITGFELKETRYRSASLLQEDLSFFEGRSVALDEVVSIVEFSYLTQL